MQLDGVRDLSQFLSGPHLSMIMADYRTEVVKVERYIDVSMLDRVVGWLPNNVDAVFADCRPSVVRDERSWDGHSFYNIYGTQDGALGSARRGREQDHP